MKAAYWTQFGAMAMPLGVVLIALSPNLRTVAVGLIIAGFISFIAGWGYTIRDERRNDAKEKEEKKQRQVDGEHRQEEHIRYLATLRIIAKRLGANSVITRRQIEREVEHFREGREVRDDI